MNIKGIVSNLVPVDIIKRDLRKTRNTTEREPNQGGGSGGEPPPRHKFTDEELQNALSFLKELPGVKENNLQFRIERKDDRVVIFVEDYTGKVISRIPDTTLWSLMQSKQKTTRGNLLNKSL